MPIVHVYHAPTKNFAVMEQSSAQQTGSYGDYCVTNPVNGACRLFEMHRIVLKKGTEQKEPFHEPQRLVHEHGIEFPGQGARRPRLRRATTRFHEYTGSQCACDLAADFTGLSSCSPHPLKEWAALNARKCRE